MKTISKFHRVGLVRNLFTLRERFFQFRSSQKLRFTAQNNRRDSWSAFLVRPYRQPSKCPLTRPQHWGGWAFSKIRNHLRVLMGCTTWAGRWIFLGGDLQQRHPWVGDCRSRRLCILRKLVRHWIGTNAAIYVDPLTIRRWKNFSPGVSDVVLGAEIIPWRVWCCNQWPIPAKYKTGFKTSLRYLSTSLKCISF